MKRFYMTLIAAAFACTAFCSGGNTAYAQEKNQNYVEIQSQSQREVVPDEIYVSIVISEKESKGKISVEEQENKMIAALKKAGIDVDKCLSVNDMDSNLQKYFLKKSTAVSSKSYTLKLKSASELGVSFDALNKAGISDISVDKAKVSDELQDKIKNELYSEAAQKAQGTARTLVESVGGKVGKVIFAQTYTTYHAARYSNIALMSKAVAYNDAAPQEETTLQMEKTTVSVTATFRFAIE